MNQPLQLQIIQKTSAKLVSATQLRRYVNLVVKELYKPKAKLVARARKQLAHAKSLTLVFVGKAEGQKLNLQFRHKDYATDVLSFAPIETTSLGELVFCIPIIRKQAKEHNLTPQQEFTYLLIHGILHLLGYDHEKNDKAATAMYRLQDSIFEKVLENGDSHRIIRRKK
jgi:probable rRNA maturation factor